MSFCCTIVSFLSLFLTQTLTGEAPTWLMWSVYCLMFTQQASWRTLQPVLKNKITDVDHKRHRLPNEYTEMKCHVKLSICVQWLPAHETNRRSSKHFRDTPGGPCLTITLFHSVGQLASLAKKQFAYTGRCPRGRRRGTPCRPPGSNTKKKRIVNFVNRFSQNLQL